MRRESCGRKQENYIDETMEMTEKCVAQVLEQPLWQHLVLWRGNH